MAKNKAVKGGKAKEPQGIYAVVYADRGKQFNPFPGITGNRVHMGLESAKRMLKNDVAEILQLQGGSVEYFDGGRKAVVTAKGYACYLSIATIAVVGDMPME